MTGLASTADANNRKEVVAFGRGYDGRLPAMTGRSSAIMARPDAPALRQASWTRAASELGPKRHGGRHSTMRFALDAVQFEG